MAEQSKDGGAAFPSTNELTQRVGDVVFGTSGHRGMSLRDYFAAKAMQALIAAAHSGHGTDAIMKAAEATGLSESRIISSAAYDYADAMLAHREKETGK